MKPENELRLARIASCDVRNGGAKALALANRATRILGFTDMGEIVSRVYAHPQGRACYDCRECGQEYLTSEESAACCYDDPDDLRLDEDDIEDDPEEPDDD